MGLIFVQTIFAESDEEILKDAYKDFSTPIVINTIREQSFLSKKGDNSYLLIQQ